MENVPAFVSGVFMVATFVAVSIFLYAVRSTGEGAWSRLLVFLLPFWIIFQFIISSYGFYQNTAALPPRMFVFGIGPALLLIILLFTFARDSFISRLSLPGLALVHIVRVPVELVLYWLAEAGTVPPVMTFHGTNLDIISGITAPLAVAAAYFGEKRFRVALIAWNMAAIGLLFNIVVTAILCVPSPIQRLALDQPNIAVLYFPYVWLPTVIVPIVFFSHLASLFKLGRIRT